MKLKKIAGTCILLSSILAFFPETSFAIDTIKPFVRSATISPNYITNGNVEIQLNASDMDSGVKSIKLPDSSVVNGSTALFTATQNGKYLFTIDDFAGNTYTHTVIVSNIDRTAPTISHLTLIEKKDKTFKVIVDADDNVEVKSVVLNTNQSITKGANDEYYVADNLATAPTSVTVTDTVGNSTGAINFLDIPTAGYSPTNATKGNVKVSINGTQSLSYKVGFNNYSCSSKPCTFDLVKNDEISATNSSLTKTSTKTFEITNIDKSTSVLNLSGTRANSKISLNWNLALTSPIVTCESLSKGKTTPTVIGNSSSFSVPNESFQCIVSGSYQGYPIESNSLTIPPDYNQTIDVINPIENYRKEQFTKAYVEYNELGETYYINVNRSDNGDKKVPIPDSLR
ncbi:hypothetical protein CON36_34410 [Bacillus cereus]|nr:MULTISPECIES: hypothetical protein [Bacillus cereus group]PDZ94325.1 hypothetical protein CON36_34410 [Bacillus cereus]PGP11905.1 hypothetical protein COA01_34355 [Bacillus cereus]